MAPPGSRGSWMTEHSFLSYLVLFISRSVLAALLSQVAAQPRRRRRGRCGTAGLSRPAPGASHVRSVPTSPGWSGPLGPAAGDLVDLVREGAHGGRDGHALDVEEADRVLAGAGSLHPVITAIASRFH